jgi:DNA-binding MarR family transcriptional regulator
MAEIGETPQRIIAKLEMHGGSFSDDEGKVIDQLAEALELSSGYVQGIVRDLAKDGLVQVDARRGEGTFSIKLTRLREEPAKLSDEASESLTEPDNTLLEEEPVLAEIRSVYARNRALTEENTNLQSLLESYKSSFAGLREQLESLLKELG